MILETTEYLQCYITVICKYNTTLNIYLAITS